MKIFTNANAFFESYFKTPIYPFIDTFLSKTFNKVYIDLEKLQEFWSKDLKKNESLHEYSLRVYGEEATSFLETLF